VPICPTVLANYVRDVDWPIFCESAVSTDVAIISHDEQLSRANSSSRKRCLGRYVLTSSWGEIWLIQLLTITEDLAIGATDGLAWHCHNAFQNDGIVAPQHDDVSVVQGGTGLIRFVNKDSVSGMKQWKH